MKNVVSFENRKLRDLNYEIWERIIHEERFPTPIPQIKAKPETQAKTQLDYTKLKDKLVVKCGLNGYCKWKCYYKTPNICTAKQCDSQRIVVL